MTAPMLLIFANKKHTWNLYSFVDDKVFDLQLSLPNKRYCGSSFGWLIAVEKNFAVTLINPFLRVQMKIIIGVDGLDNAASMSSRLQCQQTLYQMLRIAYWRSYIWNCVKWLLLGTTWTYIDTGVDKRGNLVQEVAHVEDKFYGVDHWNRLLSLACNTLSQSLQQLLSYI